MHDRYRVEYIPLVNLFKYKNTTLSVPSYQRNYVWKKDNEINEFYNDFIEGFGDKSKFIFLGNFILCDNNETLEVVDGQQRLTTIFIMMVALRSVIKSKISQDDEYKESLDIAYTTLNDWIRIRDNKKSTHVSSRLDAAPSIKNIIEYISKQSWDEDFPSKIGNTWIKGEKNRVKPIYDFFFEKINEFKPSKLIDFIEEIQELKGISIHIAKMEDAFELFERTNARGKELEISDLLKNFLFSKIKDEKEIENHWQTITENSNNNIAQFIKYFYVSKFGYVKKSDLYRSIKNKYPGSENAISLRDDLLQFSKFYNVLTSKDTVLNNIFDEFVGVNGEKSRDKDRIGYIFNSLNALDFFRVTQTIPLIYSFKNKFLELGLNDLKKYKNTMNFFLKYLENYHFINNFICTRVGNDVEKLYALYSEKFNNAKDNDDFDKILFELQSTLKDKLASYEEFKSEFIDLSYSTRNTAHILYIFDRLNAVDEKNKPLPYDSMPAIHQRNLRSIKGSFNIEHWGPQAKFDELDISNVGHNIGNLLVLPVKLNSSLNDKTPMDKCNIMKNSSQNTLQHNKNFIKEYEEKFSNWNEEAIKSRASSLADFAYNIIWKI